MDAFIIDNPGAHRDLSVDLLDEAGQLRVMPAVYYEATTRTERALFATRHAFYGLPTTELVDYLKRLIGGRSALEIGAGAGTLAAALGIRATDNHQQERPEIKAYYDSLRTPVIRYGRDVERLDAHEAVKKYRPQVVVASWVTHRFDPARADAGGNEDGVDEKAIIDACDDYIFVGNEKVHAAKPIWSLPHVRLTPPWLFSRSMQGSPDFIAIWSKTTLAGG